QRQTPWHLLPLQDLQCRLPEQTRMVVEDERPGLAGCGSGRARRAKPERRYPLDQRAVRIGPRRKECDRDVEAAGAHVSFEGMVAAGPHLDMNTRPAPREAREHVGHHVLEEI